MTLKTTVFIESIDFTEAQVDTENHVIQNVVLIRAGKSQNNRNYSEGVLQEAATRFENANAYADHPARAKASEARSIRETTGWYKNVRYENGALRADRHFVLTAAGQDVWAIASAIAENKAPRTLAGLSINATGKGKVIKFDDGQEGLEVESIDRAYSVDDVAAAAAGGGYRLTASADNELTASLLSLLEYQEWFDARPEFTERLKKEVQKVRLTDETKTQLAEADRKVKAANEALDNEQKRYTELQAYVTALENQNAKLLTEVESARGKLLIQETLERLVLPATYKQDLRTRLPKLPMSQWQSTIDTEISKATRIDANKPKIAVTGAGYKESQPITPQEVKGQDFLLPRDGENIADWQARINASR